MSSDLNNPLLRQAEDHLESQLTPVNRADYMKIVVAGMHIALDKGPDSILASLKLSKDPVKDAAEGAINIAMIMRKQSKGTMPIKAMVPAALTLMFGALDFADRTGIAKIGKPELDRAAHIFTDRTFALFRITKPMLASLTQRVHTITQDPVAMREIAMRAGTVRHPGAPPHGPVPT